MFNVPLGTLRFKQCILHKKLQHRRFGVVVAAGDHILLNLCSVETLQSKRRGNQRRPNILTSRSRLTGLLFFLAFLIAPAVAAPTGKSEVNLWLRKISHALTLKSEPHEVACVRVAVAR
jgi:hypothetical protein